LSDLDGLPGIYAPSLRWNAAVEIHNLGFSVYDPQTGERGLQPIELGPQATFALDLLTRERGLGKIKVGLFEKLLTPVGSPLPPLPDDPELKPMFAAWVWNPTLGEGRIETCATLCRNALVDIVAKCLKEPSAVEGLQPVIQFTGNTPVLIKALGRTFYAPVIERIGWIDRNKVPGWADRAPTVPPPAALPLLTASAPVSAVPAVSARRHKAVRPATKPVADKSKDPNDELPPWGQK
jgi:hypothetical protein